MFTGLVQALGRIHAVEPDGHGGRTLAVHEPSLAPLLAVGESVAVNGVCLTVTAHDAEIFRFQAGPETLLRTNIGALAAGDAVNLERALRVGDLLGGHFVSGHVDAVGTITAREPAGDWETVRFACPADLDELFVAKGSVAIDGISLTLVDVAPGTFSVMLIPHTNAHTTLGRKAVGDAVNLEADMLAKHVRKLIQTLRITI